MLSAVCLRSEAAEPALVRLAVSDGKDVRFAHLTSKDGLSPGQIRDILQDDQGFLWFNTSGLLNRYDGYQFKSYRRDPAHGARPGRQRAISAPTLHVSPVIRMWPGRSIGWCEESCWFQANSSSRRRRRTIRSARVSLARGGLRDRS